MMQTKQFTIKDYRNRICDDKQPLRERAQDLTRPIFYDKPLTEEMIVAGKDIVSKLEEAKDSDNLRALASSAPSPIGEEAIPALGRLALRDRFTFMERFSMAIARHKFPGLGKTLSPNAIYGLEYVFSHKVPGPRSDMVVKEMEKLLPHFINNGDADRLRWLCIFASQPVAMEAVSALEDMKDQNTLMRTGMTIAPNDSKGIHKRVVDRILEALKKLNAEREYEMVKGKIGKTYSGDCF